MKMFHFRMKTTILKLVKKQKMVAITMTMFFCSALHLQRTGRNHPNKTRVKACRNRSSHRGKFCFIGAFDSDYLFHVVNILENTEIDLARTFKLILDFDANGFQCSVFCFLGVKLGNPNTKDKLTQLFPQIGKGKQPKFTKFCRWKVLLLHIIEKFFFRCISLFFRPCILVFDSLGLTRSRCLFNLRK